MDTTGTGALGTQDSQDGNGQSGGASGSVVQPDLMAQFVQGLQAVIGMAPGAASVKSGGMKDFKSLRPTEFNGSGGPIVAKEWMEQIDHMLTAALIPEEQKVKVVQIQFVGMAM